MGQVNITYGEGLEAALDRVASERRTTRSKLMRAIATEAVEAHDAGRLAFQRDEAPRLDLSINALVTKLEEGIVELERTQRANRLHEKKLLGAWAGSEEAVRAAQEKIAARLRDINIESYRPFYEKADAIFDQLDEVEERVLAAMDPGLDDIRERLDQVLAAAGEAKVQHNLVLGDNRALTLRFLLLMYVPVGLLFILLFLLFVDQVQSLAVPVAHRMLDDSEHVCRLLNRRYGVTDCKVPEDQRKPALQAIEADK